MSRPDYDAIASLYDVDMARNMPFDDVGFYARTCLDAGGRVLELGCGNGRILLSLLEGGVDAVGVDASGEMLKQLRERRDAPVAQMDARALAFAPAFELVLCPYSLITYMARDGDAQRLLDEAHRVLMPGGRIVVDAFIPRAGMPGQDFSVDYRRPCGEGMLERAKRVTPLAPGRNRIERRYRVYGPDAALTRQIDTCEDIRLFAPEELTALLQERGYSPEQQWWDYSSRERPDAAQFFTVVARRPG